MRAFVFLLISVFVLPCSANPTGLNMATMNSSPRYFSPDISFISMNAKPPKKKHKRSTSHNPRKGGPKRKHKKSSSHNAVYKRKGNGIL